MKQNTTKTLFIFLMAFLGIGAIGGGGVFIISPDGSLIGMPVSILANSPFDNFLIPGIILFTVLGLTPILLAMALYKKTPMAWPERLNFFSDMLWPWSYSIYVAFALIVWLQVQMTILQAVHWLHTFYMFYAIVIIFIGLLPGVRGWYKK